MRTARSRSSGEYLLGRAMGSILSRNEPSDNPGGLHEPGDIAIKRRVVVEQHEAVRTIARKHVSQLLHHPRGRRLAGHVEMQNRAAMYSMTKKHESSWKVNVGTVKKSQATIASR
jgi:hypothetical protein